MRLSQGYWQTLKETPSDADVVSQQLMMRAGLMVKTGAGLYTYQPMAFKALKKIEKIIREELDKIKKEALQDKEQIQEIVQAQTEKLSTIARLSQEEAKEELMNNITIENEQEIKEFVEKYRTIKKEEADNEAMQIIARVMPRLATDSVNQFTSELIDIPDEGYKGKLIGREGRNISFFEKVTGVELIIDDTPGVVRISCYEHEKRFI